MQPHGNGRLVRLVLAGFVALAAWAFASVPGASAQSPGTVTGSKTVAPRDIPCDGTAHVEMVLDGETGIAGSPADIVLALDRSQSMAGALADLKTAANLFIDEIDEGTDGALNGMIANGSRVGVVSFATTATLDQPLSDDADASKGAVNALAAAGLTNHQDAFDTAQAQLAGGSPDDYIIMFTDGEKTAGGDASAAAANARAAGTTIYSIGLGAVDNAALEDWATDPDAEHVFITPSSSDLDAIFQAIGAAIVVPSGSSIEIVDTVHPHFSISNAAVTKGTLIEAGNVLTWEIEELGTEQARLTYDVTHDASQPGGTESVNTSVTYSDDEGHAIDFGDPQVNVRGCPAELELTPEHAVNELGTPGQTHAVQATLTDDFGDPIGGEDIAFSVFDGPNEGAAGSDDTNAAGVADFAYTAEQGPDGLGTDAIRACLTGTLLCDTARKEWRDTTPPSARCDSTTNPAGKTIPPAGSGDPPGGKGGQNDDGFYVLISGDAVDPDPEVFVRDAGSGTVFGPFASGTRIKYTQAPGATPSQKPMSGVIDWHLTGKGDAEVYAVDDSGNQSEPVLCKVPPPPK